MENISNNRLVSVVLMKFVFNICFSALLNNAMNIDRNSTFNTSTKGY